MRRSIVATTMVLGCVTGMPLAQAALAEHFGKTISLLEAADSPCIFFQLTGVTEANPVVPSGVWFGIDKNQGNAKEMHALLLSARISGTSLTRVLTSGDVVCGVSKVIAIDL